MVCTCERDTFGLHKNEMQAACHDLAKVSISISQGGIGLLRFHIEAERASSCWYAIEGDGYGVPPLNGHGIGHKVGAVTVWGLGFVMSERSGASVGRFSFSRFTHFRAQKT